MYNLEGRKGKELKFTATDCERLKQNLAFGIDKTDMILMRCLLLDIMLSLIITLAIIHPVKARKRGVV